MIMTDINVEKIKVSTQQELVNAASLAAMQQMMVFAIFLVDFSKIVKEKIEFLALDTDSSVSNRSIQILEEQTEDQREAHRQLQKIKRHRETPDLLRKAPKKV